MDYDVTAMPAVYDAGRGYTPELMQYWLDRIAAALGRKQFDTILDIGCRTGRFSGPLSDYFDARVIGVEPSEKMLAEARSKGETNTVYHVASAENLPVGDNSVDLVYLSMVLHHFDKPAAAIGEIFRALKPGGFVALRGGSRERINQYPYVPFFPATAPLLKAALQPARNIQELFLGGGLNFVRHKIIESPVAASWREFAVRTSYRADSILAQLGDQEFSQGMERLHIHAKKHPETNSIIEEVDLLIFRKPTDLKRSLVQ